MRFAWLTFVSVILAGARVSAGDFEFVVIGDTRPTFESESFKPFERLITRINALNPAFVVNLGDLIYGYGPARKEKQWDKYDAVIKTLKVPYYQLPGNHDTHSREARRIYGRRFGKFYESFNHQDCHFVLLDNTEQQRWGYMGPAELAWLKNDLQTNHARSVFVFMHFPVWEPERITPEYYNFWAQTLHPLFKQSRVRAVFGGHYHAYGPTREFDGIRYFITGGGGAELRPEYKKSGGEHHFMRVRVSGESVDVRVVTERGELTDSDADVMGGLQFAARNVSRIGIKYDAKALRAGTRCSVSVKNPFPEAMSGRAAWLMDESAFSMDPVNVPVLIPAGATHQYDFTLRALKDVTALESLPRLEFNVVLGGTRRRFRREIRFLEEWSAPFRRARPVLDGKLADWNGVPVLKLEEGGQPAAELRGCRDEGSLYLALSVPKYDADEAQELGFTDEVQIGMARPSSTSEFGGDFLRLGLNSNTRDVIDRTPGHKLETMVPGARSVCWSGASQTTFEMAIPLRLVRTWRAGTSSRVILDLSFPQPEGPATTSEPLEPAPNSFSYRVRYGSDSLLPVYFVELSLEQKH